MRLVLVVVALAGCARGSRTLGDDNPAEQDASIRRDAVEQFVDAAIDARPDARPDAPPDACIPQVTQLLVNPVFDLAPMGTNWTQTLILPQFPIITDQDGILENTAPYKAWLGGIEANIGQNVTDILTQDVAIPANTTQLVLTGVFEVRSGEPATTVMYDTGSLSVTQTNGTPIATILSLSNLATTTSWIPINHIFTQNLSGQTVRLRMTSSNDDSFASSFYFDSMGLTATHGCP